MVGGNTILKYTQPKAWRAWPMISLKFWVLTIDYRGNIIWPTRWEPDAKKLLSELARRKVVPMLAHEQYPLRSDFCTSPGVSSAVATPDTPLLPAPTVPTLLLQ